MEDQNNSEEQMPVSDSVERTLAELQEENQMLMNSWKRTQADFENYKRRKEQENAELVEFARQVAVVKMLPSIDSIMQGLQHVPDDASKMEEWKSGIAGTVKQLDKALEEMNIKKIEAVGKKFDPNFHEAVRQIPGSEDDMVVEEYQTGYEINGKVIRPSQVAISKKE